MPPTTVAAANVAATAVTRACFMSTPLWSNERARCLIGRYYSVVRRVPVELVLVFRRPLRLNLRRGRQLTCASGRRFCFPQDAHLAPGCSELCGLDLRSRLEPAEHP